MWRANSPMRFATIQSPSGGDAIPVVAANDRDWVEVAALKGGEIEGSVDAVSWLMAHRRSVEARLPDWSGARFRDTEIRFLPPIPRPPAFRDFYAFEQHVKTARGRRGLEVPPAWYEIPAFYFSNHNALIGHDAPVRAPVGCEELDYELELGVVIGVGGRDIAPERAWEHVFGFTIVNDLSARDLQRKEMSIGLGPAKGKDFATAVGPWIVSRRDFEDRVAGGKLTLAMSARVNGRELSRGNVSTLHHSIPEMIAFASRDAELFPGDLLGTGTVGTGCILELGPEHTGGWLKPGDVVELEVERIGALRTRIVSRR